MQHKNQTNMNCTKMDKGKGGGGGGGGGGGEHVEIITQKYKGGVDSI